MEPSCNELHHKLTSGGPNRRTPTEEPGRGTVELTVGNLGGNPQNMWSPPEGLRGTRLYLSAATGEVTDQEVTDYSTYPITNQIAGSLLEAGIEHTTDYLDKGIHGWTMFGQQLQRTWDGIKPALQ
ncbi:hypothetical protein ACL1C0_02080 [Corynebacterium striatum]|uniref:hypothetical protein n=1 Tax=Corynebacterium striatum TaxID=43770 RepID=UPI0036F8AC9A